MNERPERIPSFGRRKGHKLRPSRDHLMETLLPRLLITLPEGMLSLQDLFENNTTSLWMEIGFGSGEHLVEQASRHRDINFIGCEPYINGMAKLLAAIEERNLNNIRLFDGDARQVLDALPDDTLDRLFVLFPDPWPKNRHHKRRIVSLETLGLFYKKIKSGGLLRLATDHVDYGTWMLEHLLTFGKFRWTAKCKDDFNNPPVDWVPTRYQAKAEADGRMPLFLDFRK